MKSKKRVRATEITVERSEVSVVRRAKGAAYAWCGRCGARARMLPPEEAARAAGVSARTIYRWVEAGRVHFAETADGLLLVCLDSLIREEMKR